MSARRSFSELVNPAEIERFWARVDKDGPTPERGSLAALRRLGPCWVWTGATTRGGYGQVTMFGRHWEVHQLSWLLAGHRRPLKGRCLDHLCRHKTCVNPAHLEPVTIVENIQRGLPNAPRINAAKTQCPHGHPYDEANTYTYRGRRYCRTCDRLRKRKSVSTSSHQSP